jgi:exodeoxyribonuclease VII small subunit
MPKKQTFETALQKLEQIVKEMESGNLSLEDAVAKYEAGIKQSKFCIDYLDKIEKKISLISPDDHGKLKENSFED